jgi:hypothetical protein
VEKGVAHELAPSSRAFHGRDRFPEITTSAVAAVLVAWVTPLLRHRLFTLFGAGPGNRENFGNSIVLFQSVTKARFIAIEPSRDFGN